MNAEPVQSELVQTAIAAIESAFANVRLGNGVSIRQADAMDNYDGEEEQAAARLLDEHEDWRLIDKQVIISAPAAMCFMDTEGILFQLPASMCFTLRHYWDVANCSAEAAPNCVTDAGFIKRFKPLMTSDQIAAIVLFLKAHCEMEPCMKEDYDEAIKIWLS